MARYSVDIQAQLKGFEEIEQKLKGLSSKPIDVKINLTGTNGDISQQVKNQLSSLKQEFNTVGKESANQLYSGMKSVKFSGDIIDFTKAKESAAKQTQDIAKTIESNLNSTQSKSTINKWANEFEKNMTAASEKAVANFQKSVQKFYDANTKMHSKYGSDVLNLLDQSRTPGLSTAGLKDLQNRYASLQNTIVSAGLTGKSFSADVKRGFEQIGQFVGTYGIYMQAVDVLRNMAQEVINVDSAMTELKKVSDASGQEIANYFSTAADDAKELGATISDVISSTADWSKLGYNLEDAKELSRITTLYQNVGDNMTQESASESMVSTLQGFQMDTDEALHIVDSFNEVANKFAIDSKGIGEALQRSASSMNAAGNTMEETIGLVTAANTVVQDPASVGTAFKTISMRIRGAKTEMEELGLDTEGMVESTATLRDEIKALTGVDIMENATTFKSTYDILDELATKWQNLTDIQQASVTELIAGKRQGNIVSALMQNFDIARNATETALKSDGSALREQERYMESVQYSIDKFQAQFQELSNVTVGSDFLKGVIDGGSSALDIITQLIDKFGILTPLIAGLGGSALSKYGLGKQVVVSYAPTCQAAL